MHDPSTAVRRARWAVAAIFLANGAIIGTWAAHIPLVEARLGISHTLLGFALLAMALGALIAMPLGGLAIGRYGSAAITRAATLVWVVAFPLPIAAPSPPLLIAALLLFGAANGVMDVAMNAHAVAVERQLGRPVMSSYHGMWSLGGLTGAGAAAILLPVMPAIGEALLAIVAIGGVAIVALFSLLPSSTDGGNGGSAFALPSKAALGLGVLCFLCMTSEGAVLDWSALQLGERLELAPGLAGAGFAGFSATMAAGRFAGDWLRGHIGGVALVRWSACLAAAGLSVALLAPGPFLAIFGYALTGFGLANLVPVFFGAAGRIPGETAGTGIAAVATIGYAGFLLGPPVIGFVADLSSLTLALGLVVLACIVIALFARVVEPADPNSAG